MKTNPMMTVAVLIVASGLVINLAQSQQPGVTRTDLLRHDLSVSEREVIQVRVDFAPGAAFPAHSHPGEEIAYVIEGLLEYRLEGSSPVRGRRVSVYPGRNGPCGEERRQRQRGGARDVHRRKGQATRRTRSAERLCEVTGSYGASAPRRRERRVS